MKLLFGVICLQGMACVVFLFNPSTLETGIILLVLTILLISSMVYMRIGQKRRLRSLHNAIEMFMTCGKEPSFSLNEDDYAEIENDIAQLAHEMTVQKEIVYEENHNTIDFIVDISHQLKTPLASIKLYSELQNGKYTEKQLILIENMEKMVYSLLRLQKLKAGAYEMHFKLYDMKTLIFEVWEELRVLYPRKMFHIDGSIRPFRCDGFWLGEAFKNLFKNACEHTAEDGNLIVILTQAEKSVLISIEDDGGGVSEFELPQLFRRFYRSSKQHTGTGLGLAITKTIVERHHGSMSAENTDRGLRVTICMPVLDGVLLIP